MITAPTIFSNRSERVPPSFIREILKAAGQPNMISLAGGLPESSLFPAQYLAKSAYRVLMNSGHEALQYTTTEGYAPLRKYIAQRYQNQEGITVDPEQVLITSGSQQALDLIGKLFIDPGDVIILERPSYLGAIQCFNQYAPRILEVDLHEEGPDQEQLKNVLDKENVKLFYTIPNFQNPTGRVHTLESRKRITNLIKDSTAYIVEDDPYGEIRFEEECLPTLHALFPERTILLGTFSKTVAPGLRIGWVIANPEIIRRLSVLKQASDLHSSHLDQRIVYDYLTHYDLDEHIGNIIHLYKRRRDVMKAAMEEEFPSTVNYQTPKGGMFFWIKFSEQVKALDLLQKSMSKGIIFVPGETFYSSCPVLNTARFNFSNTEEEKIKQAIKVLGKLIRQEEHITPLLKWWAIP